ncbi:hypothetical protein GZH47_33675 (plasmid) [Paenibacillus rhizovicinus]|uniref:Uncharacterized protein n=1 Tax=Paenibacillus rhizovicinus TaxID=2704463 RepID=A0A6C0PB86_9BACL|nr:hypothetical protein [Paenibacillus rhizovicinus]QHW35844.1 hypothetical protein GZH47_33675 [Paenibacillus rhizovicinus]
MELVEEYLVQRTFDEPQFIFEICSCADRFEPSDWQGEFWLQKTPKNGSVTAYVNGVMQTDYEVLGHCIRFAYPISDHAIVDIQYKAFVCREVSPWS